MLVPNTNTRAWCNGDDESAHRPATRTFLIGLYVRSYLPSFLRARSAHTAAMSAEPYPPAASTSYILVVNVVGVLLCLAVVLVGRMRRSSRAEETRCYTPGPYWPVSEEGSSIKGGGEPKGSGVKPSPKAKPTSSAKVATKRR